MKNEKRIARFAELVDKADHITVIQAENPDADSLGSAVALENILGAQGKDVHMHCAVEIPRYLRYITGWSRVDASIPKDTELLIVVDTSAQTLLEKTKAILGNKDIPLIVLDHHKTDQEIEFTTLNFNEPEYAATGHLIADITKELKWPLNHEAAESLIYAILGDTLGLVSIATTQAVVQTVADLMIEGVSLHDMDERRREYGKKDLRIIAYKGVLLQRIAYAHDQQIAHITIPLEEVKEYSDLYNPSALVMEELRSAEKVRIALSFKHYDERITCKLREINDAPICNRLAAHFGGGGHPFAAGFKVDRSDMDAVRKEALQRAGELLDEHDQR